MINFTIYDQDDAAWQKKKKEEAKKGAQGLMKKGELIGKKGKDLVSIPLPQIEIPTFRHGKNQKGVGQGEGEVGSPFAPGDPQGAGQGAGEIPGEHLLEVEIELETIIKILMEEIELPELKPKGKQSITEQKEKYNTIRRTGPKGLVHKKRTYLASLKRGMSSGECDFAHPVVVPEKDDWRIKSWKTVFEPKTAALIILIMDVSGSMGDEQKEITRITAFWIEKFVREKYKDTEVRHIIHDAAARQVDSHTFYHTRESGGTKISSAYREAANMIDPKKGSVIGTERIAYNADEINIFCFHFSDGDNWGGGDTKITLEILENELLPNANLFGYFQVQSAYGTGKFKKDIEIHFKDGRFSNMKTAEISGRDEIYEAIIKTLGKKNKA